MSFKPTASNQRRSGQTASARLLIASLVIAGLLVLIACRRGSELTSTNTNQATPPDRRDLLNQPETLIFDGREISWQEFFDSGGRCSTPAVSLVEAGDREKRAKEFKLDKKNLERTKLIEVYFHVIKKGDQISDGNIEKAQIDEQMNVLNEKYYGTGFQFRLLPNNIDRKTCLEWYEMGYDTPAEHAAMEKLGVQKKEVLNVYTARLSSTTAGWAVYPWHFSEKPYRDGVVIRFSTLPGGTWPYDEGLTLVHEVGHWLGLLHTYDNRCYPPGDYVEGTPPEDRMAGHTCRLGRDTCIDGQGPDPVDNFMDTSVDSCAKRFMPGQLARMNLKFEECRRLGLPCLIE